MPLMSYEEYKEKGIRAPYELIIGYKENYLYYFGEVHTNDINHPQWTKWRKFWTEFLEKTKGKNRIVLVEGNSTDVFPTEEESVTKMGGMGMATFHAAQNNIEISSPEPERDTQLIELEKEYPRELINYFYIARQIAQWGRMIEPRPDLESYLAKYMEFYGTSLEKVKSTHRKLFGKELDEGETRFSHDIVDPAFPDKSIINEISRKLSDMRNEHIAKKISEYMHKDVSVFAQFGHTHVVIQEPLLKELLDTIDK
jgi:hypothetical protein